MNVGNNNLCYIVLFMLFSHYIITKGIRTYTCLYFPLILFHKSLENS